MGRLFWKFFFFFWLAQVVTSAGVGALIWLARPEHSEFRSPPGPPPGFEAPRADGPPPGPPGAPHPRHERPSRLLLPIAAGGIVSLFFAALLAWYFSRPIRTLRTAFDAFADGALETRVAGAMGRRRDELADLGSDFDRMATRLQGLIEARRRLLHEVSHELRSPLARLQAAADLLRQQPERAGEFIERIERESGRMDCLIGELLDLDRIDAGIDRIELDLREVIDAVAEDAAFEAAGKSCRVAVEAPAVATTRGNAELLCRALENVVRNALRFAPVGSAIELGLQAVPGGGWELGVADRGPGVPEAQLERIFEPFQRAENNGGQVGYGLGLALTRRVVEAHGGTVAACNRAGGGLVVTIRLPGAGAQAGGEPKA